MAALGRLAELNGEAALPADRMSRSFGVSELARREYETSPPQIREMVEAYVDGVALSTLNEARLSDLRLNKIGFVFQAYNLIPVLSARENVEFIMQLQGVSAKERSERAVAMLGSLGIGDLANRRPGELSGGQQQRVAVARAIVTNPVLLLADEPSANLDSTTTEELLGLLTQINRKHGVTILTATHDPVVMGYAGRHVQLKDGRIVSDEKADSAAA